MQFTSSHPDQWLQEPPATVPWRLPNQSLPDVIRFTGNQSHGFPSQGKRKLVEILMAEQDYFTRPSKLQAIDTVATCLNDIHIGANYTTHHLLEPPVISEEGASIVHNDGGIDLQNLPSLVMCEDLRHLVHNDIILPELLFKMPEPCQEIVLWKPPSVISSTQLREPMCDIGAANNNNEDERSCSSSSLDTGSSGSSDGVDIEME